MTKFIRAASAAAILTSGLCSAGCVTGGHGGGSTIGDHARKYHDPCYPERYNHAARQAVLAPFAQQVHNGNVLHQTIYTYQFEDGSDKLTPAGMAKLDSIARARPVDPKLFIQAATDLPLTDANAGKIVELRSELDAKRAASIQKYLASVPTYGPVNYEIHVHNPATPGISAEAAAGAYRGSLQDYSGGIGGGGGAGGGSLSTGGGANLTAPPAAGGAPR
jgi:hypothetical protein